jgi:glycosidase
MKYYLDLGVKGFRLDVITLINKPKNFSDILDKIPDFKSYAGYPGIFDYYKEMRENIDSYPVFLIGECSGIPLNKSKKYSKYLDLMLNFDLFNIDGGETFKWNDNPFSLDKAIKVIIKQQNYLKENNIPLFLENHDQPRITSRLSSNKSLELFNKSTTAFAGFFYLLKGTNIIFQGQEIGMENQIFNNIGEIKDIEAINAYNIYSSELDMMKFINLKARDHSRIVIPWDDSINKGFSKSKPWFMISNSSNDINVMNSINDKNSILNFYKKIIDLKHKNLCASNGELSNFSFKNNIVSYSRVWGEKQINVIVNFNDYKVKSKHIDKNNIIISNYDINDKFELNEYEVVVWEE